MAVTPPPNSLCEIFFLWINSELLIVAGIKLKHQGVSE